MPAFLWHRFGGVYQSQVVRDVSYVDLQKLLLKEMTNMVTNDTLTSEQEVSHNLPLDMFSEKPLKNPHELSSRQCISWEPL